MQQTKTKWTTGLGNEIEVIFSADFDLDSQGRRKTAGEKVIVTTLFVDGKKVFAPMGVQTFGKPMHGCVGRIGDIGIKTETMEKLVAAKAEVSRSIAAHNADCARHAAELSALGTGDINTEFGQHA